MKYGVLFFTWTYYNDNNKYTYYCYYYYYYYYYKELLVCKMLIRANKTSKKHCPTNSPKANSSYIFLLISNKQICQLFEKTLIQYPLSLMAHRKYVITFATFQTASTE